MALESASYVGALVATNPTSSDPKSQGDDHLRLIKQALLNSFAGFSGGILCTGTDGGVADTYTVTPASALSAYVSRLSVIFSPVASNTGTAPSLNVSGLGAVNLKRIDGSALVAGELVLGSIYIAIHTGSEFRLLAPTKQYIDQLAFSTALPAQAGNAGKFVTTNGTTASWAQAGSGLGGTTGTGSISLTSASPAAMTVTPASPGLYATLPDATTCSKADNLYSIYNAGDYDFGVKDTTGTKLGWVRARTGAMIGLADSSTAAGVWSCYGLEKLGATAQYNHPTLANMSTTSSRIDLDSNRFCVLFGGTDCYAIVYDASTCTWGAATLVRSGVGSGQFVGVLSAANQVLVVSVSSGTAMEAVTLSMASTTITVNSGSKATAVCTASTSLTSMIAVGASWVFAMFHGSVTAIQAVSVSGTTPTLGVETALAGDGTTALLFASASVVRTLCSSAAGTVLNCAPYTLSGVALSAGTAATRAISAASFRAFVNGNGNIVIGCINTTVFACVLKLSGTVEALSSVNTTASPATASYAVFDFVPVTTGKTALIVDNGSATFIGNILTDTAGTGSLGTAVTGTFNGTNINYVINLGLTGNVARFAVGASAGSASVNFVSLDCSGVSPTIASRYTYLGAAPSFQTFVASNANCTRTSLRAGSNVIPVPTSNSFAYLLQASLIGLNLTRTILCNSSISFNVGSSESDAVGVGPVYTAGNVGITIQKLEIAA